MYLRMQSLVNTKDFNVKDILRIKRELFFPVKSIYDKFP